MREGPHTPLLYFERDTVVVRDSFVRVGLFVQPSELIDDWIDLLSFREVKAVCVKSAVELLDALHARRFDVVATDDFAAIAAVARMTTRGQLPRTTTCAALGWRPDDDDRARRAGASALLPLNAAPVELGAALQLLAAVGRSGLPYAHRS